MSESTLALVSLKPKLRISSSTSFPLPPDLCISSIRIESHLQKKTLFYHARGTACILNHSAHICSDISEWAHRWLLAAVSAGCSLYICIGG